MSAFEFTQAIADEICERLIEGESLRSICKSPGMPSAALVCRWCLDEDKIGFREQYARAREAQADTLADEILDIADDGSNDWLERQNAAGETYDVVNAEAVARSRLRVDVRKWYAGKLRPKRYGEKLDIEHAGEVKVTEVKETVVDPRP